jgi:hypothetical protein
MSPDPSARPGAPSPDGPVRFLDHDFPEVFTVWAWSTRSREWWHDRTCRADELERLDDGAYVHATIGSPLYLRIVSRRGGVLRIEDGGGRRWRCLVLPDVGDTYENPWGTAPVDG